MSAVMGTVNVLGSGSIAKMRTALENGVAQYRLPLGDTEVPMNPLIGRTLSLRFEGSINCVHCDRKTNKSFNQGYCYPCFRRLAQCDICIVSPEKCHYFAGTCREPEWGDKHCMTDHIVYLANTSKVKVGITRASQIPTRWIDQGAVQALPIYRVSNRLHSGLLEQVFKAHVADKTSWQAMLKAAPAALDLAVERDRLMQECNAELAALAEQYGGASIKPLLESDVTISFPVQQYPEKVKAFNLDKDPRLEGQLLGIKGQYLIFDTGVINLRKYGGYRLELAVH